MNKLNLFSLLFVFLTVSINAQKLYYPEDKWEEKNPEAYDKLLMEKGDTLDFQGEFDRSVQRDKNAGGGLSYLMGM